MKDKGFLYVATGNRYVNEAIASAKSVKQHMPNANIVLFSDIAIKNDIFDQIYEARDVRHYVTDKIHHLLLTPFKKTIFLDTDTIVCRSINEIFLLLDRFELAAAVDIRGGWYPSECNSFFPEFNTGVIAYRSCEKAFNTISLWDNIYKVQEKSHTAPPHDQPSFRDAVYRSDVHFSTLASEYNLRTIFPMIISRCIQPAILHGRNISQNDVKYFTGCIDEPRVIMPYLSSLVNGQIGFLTKNGKIFTNFLWNIGRRYWRIQNK